MSMKTNFFRKATICMALLLATCFLQVSCDTSGGCDSGRRDCVVVIGDSIFALYNNIIPEFQRLSGFSVRRYDTSGSEMIGGIAPTTSIVAQFRRAVSQGHVRTLIMDGGGNDFIISGAVTNAREQVRNGYREIFDIAAQNGVENIVVMGYYRTASTSAVTDASEQDVEELTLGYARQKGLNTAHFDPSDNSWFSSKRPAQYINPADITRVHPSNQAGAELAREIWATMTKNFSSVVTSDQNYQPMEQGGSCSN